MKIALNVCLFILTVGATLLPLSAMATTRLHREMMLNKNMQRNEAAMQAHKKVLRDDKHLATITNRDIVSDEARLQSDMKEFGWNSAKADEDRETLQKDRQTLRAVDTNETHERKDVGKEHRQITTDETKLQLLGSVAND